MNAKIFEKSLGKHGSGCCLGTCAYFPLLVSLWHITYLLFYSVMFMRLVILELDRYSRWIKGIGILLIGLRFADWPYELTFISIQRTIMMQTPGDGSTCWATWGSGVIILNFVGDALANLFLSGMFIRRLLIHINNTKTLPSNNSKLIENIARKSLICLALTFVVNLIMNILKVTTFIGSESDAFTVYFELIESTLLVEALRNDSSMRAGPNTSICESCHKELNHSSSHKRPNRSEEHHHSQMLVKSFGESSNKKNYRSASEIDDTTSYDDRTIGNVAPVEPAMFPQRQQHHQHPPQFLSSFSTSLTPRPPMYSAKEPLNSSLGSPSVSSTRVPSSNESFAMDNIGKDRNVSTNMTSLVSVSETASNSNHSQATHYWKEN
ncbi:hypothetical protein G6F37_010089 [Rhizopus arrhizus]|nr:hypothetical protein G6F38_008987 [Rhizopus arrhizus]KAG1153736.1 hypothetical protein G6F37_010089 [Rhizopus arrhizus]